MVVFSVTFIYARGNISVFRTQEKNVQFFFAQSVQKCASSVNWALIKFAQLNGIGQSYGFFCFLLIIWIRSFLMDAREPGKIRIIL